MKIARNVLIVEDEAIHMIYLKTVLQSFGHNITGTAPSGKLALESVESNCPDIAILDINLADEMDGIVLANEIRKVHQFPIIFVSGYDDKSTLSRINEIENTVFLTKPVSEKVLIEAIQNMK